MFKFVNMLFIQKRVKFSTVLLLRSYEVIWPQTEVPYLQKDIINAKYKVWFKIAFFTWLFACELSRRDY